MSFKKKFKSIIEEFDDLRDVADDKMDAALTGLAYSRVVIEIEDTVGIAMETAGEAIHDSVDNLTPNPDPVIRIQRSPVKYRTLPENVIDEIIGEYND